jgi:nucleoside-diphosphate-sugar epimerase
VNRALITGGRGFAGAALTAHLRDSGWHVTTADRHDAATAECHRRLDVTDTVSGFLAVADADGCLGHVTNIGTGNGASIGDLAELLGNITGRPGLDIITDPQRLRPPASEVGTLIADASAARDRCGWTPSVDLAEGLARTVEYLRARLDRFHPDRYAI